MKISPLSISQYQNPESASSKIKFGMKVEDYSVRYLMGRYVLRWNDSRVKNDVFQILRKFAIAAEKGEKRRDRLQMLSIGYDKKVTDTNILHKKNGRITEISVPGNDDMALIKRVTEYMEKLQGKKVRSIKVTEENREQVATNIARRLTSLIC